MAWFVMAMVFLWFSTWNSDRPTTIAAISSDHINTWNTADLSHYILLHKIGLKNPPIKSVEFIVAYSITE